MDPLDRIDEIIALVEGARSVPMSRNCMLDRGELIGLLDQLRQELPTELRRATALLEERDKILDAGRHEAERIISEGEAEHARLVSVNEVTVSAEHESSRIIGEARSGLLLARRQLGIAVQLEIEAVEVRVDLVEPVGGARGQERKEGDDHAASLADLAGRVSHPLPPGRR